MWSINLLDVSYGYDTTEEALVTEHYARTGQKGGTSYFVTATTVNGEQHYRVSKQYYTTHTVGGTITVDHYNGTLGIPFDIAWE